jgi:hypothetical protein
MTSCRESIEEGYNPYALKANKLIDTGKAWSIRNHTYNDYYIYHEGE